MTVYSISEKTTYKLENKIQDKWVESPHTNTFKKHVLARGGYFLLVPAAAMTRILDTIIAIGSGIATLATLGKNQKVCVFTANYLASSEKLLSHVYVSLLRTINPEASNESNYVDSCGHGLMTGHVGEILGGLANRAANRKNIFLRHVVSRLTFGLRAIAMIVCRIADVIIGALAAVLSFLTLGKIGTINNLAKRGLMVTGIISDLFSSITLVINPWSPIRNRYQ